MSKEYAIHVHRSLPVLQARVRGWRIRKRWREIAGGLSRRQQRWRGARLLQRVYRGHSVRLVLAHRLRLAMNLRMVREKAMRNRPHVQRGELALAMEMMDMRVRSLAQGSTR